MPLLTDPAVVAALARLEQYNSAPYHAGTNPYGMENGGHEINFPQATADIALVSTAIEDEADAVEVAAALAGTYAERMSSVSTTSNVIGAGEKTWTIVSESLFRDTGQWVRAQSRAAPTVDYMLFQISGSTATTITGTVLAANVFGSGTKTDWDLLIVGAPGSQGIQGEVGPAGRMAGIPMVWSTNHANTDPTAGHVKVNNGTEIAITAFYVSETDDDGNGARSLFNIACISNSGISGRFMIYNVDDLNQWLLLNVTGALTDNGGWDTIVVTHEDHGNVIVDDASVMIVPIPTGDIGPQGEAGIPGPGAAVSFLFSSTVTDADPGPGTARVNSAAYSSATFIYFDDVELNLQNMEDWIQSLDDSSNSTDKGRISLTQNSDPSKFVHFKITGAVVDGTGYWKVPVSYVAGGITIDNAAQISVGFSPAGSAGASGEGTGDVIGPATSTVGFVPEWDNADGDLLKAGKVAPTGVYVGTTDAQTLTNKTLTAPAISSPTGIVKGDVGLGNADNTSDADKAVSAATQTALNLKAPLASPTLTGIPAAPTAAPGTNTTQLSTTAFVKAAVDVVLGGVSGVFDTLSEIAARIAQATTTALGTVELATGAEVTTGTDADRAITPDALAESRFGIQPMAVLLSDPNGAAITTGDGKAYVRIPSTLNGMDLIGVAMSLSTASSSGIPTVQLRRKRGGSDVDMLSTKVTIDVSEVDTGTAAVLAVINAANDDVQTGDHIYFDIDVAGTGAKGLLVELQFRLP